MAIAHGDRSAKICMRPKSRIRRSLGSKNIDKEETPATSGNPPKRQLLKRQLLPVCLRATPVTSRSGGPVASWPARKRFFGRLRQKPARQVQRARAASQSERRGYLTTKLLEWYNKAVTQHPPATEFSSPRRVFRAPTLCFPPHCFLRRCFSRHSCRSAFLHRYSCARLAAWKSSERRTLDAEKKRLLSFRSEALAS